MHNILLIYTSYMLLIFIDVLHEFKNDQIQVNK